MSEIKVDTVAEKTSANGVTVDGLNIKDSKLVTANSVITSNITDANITTAKILDDNVTYAKIQNVSATDRILGRDSSGAGVIEEITPANLRTMLNVADGANVGGGKILQVKQNLESNTRSTTVTSFQNIAGIEQAITPSASNSKVLVSSVLVLSCGNHGVVRFIRVTGGTTTVIGAGTTASGQKQNGSMTSNSDGNTARPQPFQFLDSPGTTSTVTYYAQWIANSSTPVYLNRTPNDANEIYGSRFSSTITLMEVGA
jgi:hypothetical protein